jgi:tellurite methyltransferase
MNQSDSGGYDDGYSKCSCFWGKAPGSLIRRHLASIGNAKGLKVLDLGCGEGKNANAYVQAGADVTAVDRSQYAIKNALQAFPATRIRWIQCDAESYLSDADTFDVIVMYGLLHCLRSTAEVRSLIDLALKKTRSGGVHIVATFNDGPHDLSAHPGFSPLLLPHEFYLTRYEGLKISAADSSILEEVHPHNNIPHFHSVTRLVAVKNELSN